MREGLWPTVLGTVVTAAGAGLLRRNKTAATGLLGFGLAHVLLGALDLSERRKPMGIWNRIARRTMRLTRLQPLWKPILNGWRG
ncbi:hypothetical protein GCM10027018_10350 [Paenibacillus thermoaerophilus]